MIWCLDLRLPPRTGYSAPGQNSRACPWPTPSSGALLSRQLRLSFCGSTMTRQVGNWTNGLLEPSLKHGAREGYRSVSPFAPMVQRCQNAELVNTINVEGSGALLAAIVGDENVLAWASRDASAGRTAAGWGRSPIAPVVRGFTAGPLFGESIDLETLLSPAAETAIVEIAGGADGPALGFGQRLRRALDARAGDLLRSVLNGGLKEIVYTDRYLFSPLSALLLTELVGAFAGRSRPDVLVHTRAAF